MIECDWCGIKDEGCVYIEELGKWLCSNCEEEYLKELDIGEEYGWDEEKFMEEYFEDSKEVKAEKKVEAGK